MSSLRTVKRNIKTLCNDIIAECIIAETLGENVDTEKLADVVENTIKLKYDSIRKVSIAFDKAPRDFANRSEYNKTRKQYFKKAFSSLDTLFFKEIESQIALLNKAVPNKKG